MKLYLLGYLISLVVGAWRSLGSVATPDPEAMEGPEWEAKLAELRGLIAQGLRAAEVARRSGDVLRAEEIEAAVAQYKAGLP